MQKYFTLKEVSAYLELDKSGVISRLQKNSLIPSIYTDGGFEVVEVGGDGY